MEIKRHKRFIKKFNKLPPHLQKKTRKVVEVFVNDSFHPSLKNHALSGRLEGMRAISVSGDIRIVFDEFDNYIDCGHMCR